MSDEIYYNQQTGKHSFYSVKDRAYHGKGHLAEKHESSQKVLENSGLNFSVAKAPNKHSLPNGTEITSTTSYFTYREDTNEVLGEHVGKEYHIVQNCEAFQFFDAIAGDEGIYFETAGALGKGERIFITAKLPGYIRVGNDDLIDKYLFLTTSHDGKTNIIAAFTPIRIVCNNTLNGALANCENMVTIKHTSNATEKLKQAHKIMGMVNTLAPRFETLFNEWAQIPIADEQLRKIVLLTMAPNKETLDKIKSGLVDQTSTMFQNTITTVMGYALISDTQQQETTRNTLFGAYNAITGYFQNVRKYDDDESKIKSIFYSGNAQEKAQTCFRICEQFAKHGDIFLES